MNPSTVRHSTSSRTCSELSGGPGSQPDEAAASDASCLVIWLGGGPPHDRRDAMFAVGVGCSWRWNNTGGDGAIGPTRKWSQARLAGGVATPCVRMAYASANARGWSIGGQNPNLRTGVIHGGRSIRPSAWEEFRRAIRRAILLLSLTRRHGHRIHLNCRHCLSETVVRNNLS